MTNPVVIYTPGHREGGTTILFRNLAEYLLLYEYHVVIVDYEDGYVRKYFVEKGIQVDWIECKEIISIPYDVTFVINSLTGKTLGSKIKLSKKSKILFHVTYIFDIVKYMPEYVLFKKFEINTLKKILITINPIRYRRIRKLVSIMDSKGSITYMDHISKKMTEKFYELSLNGEVVPLLVEEKQADEMQVRLGKEDVFKLFWVGRLEDFKYCTVCSIANVISEFDQSKFIFHIVGSGEKREFVEKYIKDLGLNCEFFGHVDYSDLNVLLNENADLVFGHGLSILNSAANGIPSFVINGTYEVVPSTQLKGNWLFNMQNGDVGSVSFTSSDFKGEKVCDLLRDLQSLDLNEIGRKCAKHVRLVHYPNMTLSKHAQSILNASFTYYDFLKYGAVEGRLVELIKSIFRPVYYTLRGIIRSDKKWI